MTLQDAVRTRLAEIMKEKGFPAYRICREGGVPRATISQILSGKNGRIKVDTLYQIIATMDVSFEEFFHSDLFRDISD